MSLLKFNDELISVVSLLFQYDHRQTKFDQIQIKKIKESRIDRITQKKQLYNQNHVSQKKIDESLDTRFFLIFFIYQIPSWNQKSKLEITVTQNV